MGQGALVPHGHPALLLRFLTLLCLTGRAAVLGDWEPWALGRVGQQVPCGGRSWPAQGQQPAGWLPGAVMLSPRLPSCGTAVMLGLQLPSCSTAGHAAWCME